MARQVGSQAGRGSGERYQGVRVPEKVGWCDRGGVAERVMAGENEGGGGSDLRSWVVTGVRGSMKQGEKIFISSLLQ